jgi:hypothetical protein
MMKEAILTGQRKEVDAICINPIRETSKENLHLSRPVSPNTPEIKELRKEA